MNGSSSTRRPCWERIVAKEQRIEVERVDATLAAEVQERLGGGLGTGEIPGKVPLGRLVRDHDRLRDWMRSECAERLDVGPDTRGCDEITGLAVDVQELAQPSSRELRVVEPSAEGDELFAHGDALAGQRWFEDQPSIGHEPISDGGEVSEPAGHVDGRSSELAGTENVLGRQATTQSDQQPRPESARLGRNAVQRLAEHRGHVMVDSPTERRTSGDP